MKIKNQFETRNKLLWCVEITNNLVLLIYIYIVIFSLESYSEWRKFLVYLKICQLFVNVLVFTIKDKLFFIHKVTFGLILFNILCLLFSLMLHYFLCYRLCIDVFGYNLHYFFIGIFFVIFINFYFIVYWIYFEKFEVPKYFKKYRIYETADL